MKNDIVDLVYSELNGSSTKKDINMILDSFISQIGNQLCDGAEVRIDGFGAFRMVKRGKRKAMNPRTGEVIQIQERVVPTFNFYDKFKRRFGLS